MNGCNMILCEKPQVRLDKIYPDESESHFFPLVRELRETDICNTIYPRYKRRRMVPLSIHYAFCLIMLIA